jgi:hypothetical protein
VLKTYQLLKRDTVELKFLPNGISGTPFPGRYLFEDKQVERHDRLPGRQAPPAARPQQLNPLPRPTARQPFSLAPWPAASPTASPAAPPTSVSIHPTTSNDDLSTPPPTHRNISHNLKTAPKQ